MRLPSGPSAGQSQPHSQRFSLLLAPQTMVQTLTEHLLCTRHQDASMDGISPWPSRSSRSRGSQVLERLDWLRSRLPPPSPSSATWAEVTSLAPSYSRAQWVMARVPAWEACCEGHTTRRPERQQLGVGHTETAQVAVFTVWSGVWSGRASQKRGPSKKVCRTDVSGVAFEGQGTAEVVQSGFRGWRQTGCLEKQPPRVKAGARRGGRVPREMCAPRGLGSILMGTLEGF